MSDPNESGPPVCQHCGEPPVSSLACMACGHLLVEPPDRNFFARLGLSALDPFDAELAERRYLQLSRLLHPDHQTVADAETQLLALDNSSLLNQAWAVVTDEQQRAEYLLELQDPGALERHKKLSPEFLMQAMELSEELEEAHETGCADTIHRIARTARGAIEARLSGVASACSETMARIARDSYAPHTDPSNTPARLVPPHEWNTEQMAVLLHQARVFRRILRDTETSKR